MIAGTSWPSIIRGGCVGAIVGHLAAPHGLSGLVYAGVAALAVICNDEVRERAADEREAKRHFRDVIESERARRSPS